MPSIHPNTEHMRQLMKTVPLGQPLVMLNQLKFRPIAQYPEGLLVEPVTGREAYNRYADIAGPCVAAVGGELLWRGEALGVMIGPEGELWNSILLIKYPSMSAFLKMLSMPEYLKAVLHRTAALEDSRLIISQESYRTDG